MKFDRKGRAKRKTGISWQLLGILTLFILFSIVVIWMFQVVLVNRFYKQSKYNEFDYTNEAIEGALYGGESISEVVRECASSYDQCIMVFERIGDKAPMVLVADADISTGCLIHHMPESNLNKFYMRARANGGRYMGAMSMPAQTNEGSEATGVLCVSIIHLEGTNREYMILLNTDLAPLRATVKTIEMQFGWIACILMMGALVIVMIISRTVCAPLERMSTSAKKLAVGDYSAEFGGGSFREVQELADALNYAAGELAKNDNLQKELVANISHDLRTPLTMIKGYSEVMRDIPGENTPENVQVIIDETERLTELVNDMLDLSKLRAGTRKPELEVVDLTETVKGLKQRYTKLTEKDGYNIIFEYDREVFVLADRTMLLQVVYNLINNAINYTGEDKTVRVIQEVTERKVRISVIDTGVGIAEEDLPYIWDRYYKVDKVHKRATVGTGLGLSIVKGVLEAHTAAYGVESALGVGSSFWFELDVIPDEKQEE